MPNPSPSDDDINAADRSSPQPRRRTQRRRPRRPHRRRDRHRHPRTQNDEDVPGLDATDLTYEVGSGSLVDGLDEAIAGAKAGDAVTFSTEVPGREGEVNFKVLVKAVKEKKLPEVTDEWASEVSEFDTVDELKADLVKRIGGINKANAQMTLRSGTAEALAEPRRRRRARGAGRRRGAAPGRRSGAPPVPPGRDAAAVARGHRPVARRLPRRAIVRTRSTAVKVDLALRAVVVAEEHRDHRRRTRRGDSPRSPRARARSPRSCASNLRPTARSPMVKLDLAKAKALQWLIDNAEVVDEEGHASRRCGAHRGARRRRR